METEEIMDISERINDAAKPVNDPAGRMVKVIHEDTAIAIAADAGFPLAAIYQTALQKGIWPFRYLRNRSSLSAIDQLRICNSSILICGAGGLGGHVILLLARIGAGHLHTFDPDVFDASNLNRQMLAASGVIGKSKAETARERVAEINPAVGCTAYPRKISLGDIKALVPQVNVVADCLDTIQDRLLLEQWTKESGIPLVHTAVAGFEGQIMTIFPEDSGLKRIYGDMPSPSHSNNSPESIEGTPAPGPGVMGSLQAMEVIKILIGRGDILRHSLLHVNLLTSHFHRFNLAPNN